MNRYHFTISCPRCGGEIEHRGSAVLTPDRTQSEVWCASCFVVWRLDVGMTDVLDFGLMFVGVDRDEALRVRAGTAIDNESVRVFE